MTNDTQTKMDFYAALGQALQVPKTDKLMVLGDFNARVGGDNNWDLALGAHGHGKVNSNGHLLLELCTEHDLAITNTFFEMSDKWFNSWQHPRSKKWHLLNYVLVSKVDLSDLCSTRAMRGADCFTDHLMIQLLHEPTTSFGYHPTLTDG